MRENLGPIKKYFLAKKVLGSEVSLWVAELKYVIRLLTVNIVAGQQGVIQIVRPSGEGDLPITNI